MPLRSSRYTGVTRGRKTRQNRDNGERALGKTFLKKKLAMGSEGRQQGRQRELRAEVMTPQTEAMVVK